MGLDRRGINHELLTQCLVIRHARQHPGQETLVVPPPGAVLQGPWTFGSGRQGKPFFSTGIMPPGRRRSSTPGWQQSVGEGLPLLNLPFRAPEALGHGTCSWPVVAVIQCNRQVETHQGTSWGLTLTKTVTNTLSPMGVACRINALADDRFWPSDSCRAPFPVCCRQNLSGSSDPSVEPISHAVPGVRRQEYADGNRQGGGCYNELAHWRWSSSTDFPGLVQNGLFR